MKFRELTIGAYSKLHDLIDASSLPLTLELLGFDYPEGKNNFIYKMQEDDFTRELVNEFNQFAIQLHRISLWEKIFADYGEDESLELRMEFTTIPLEFCLSTPYSYKSRICFCATKLCYTIGLYEKLFDKDLVQSDDKININSLERVAKYWPSCGELIAALREIDGSDFRASTNNFRNLSQHRHPVRLDYGYTSRVGISFPDTGGVSFAFGQAAPLQTKELLPILITEGMRLRKAFLAYRILVDEHLAT